MEYNCDDDPPSKKDMSETAMSPEDQRVSHTEKQNTIIFRKWVNYGEHIVLYP